MADPTTLLLTRIFDLVYAILELSFGNVQPPAILNLVSTILGLVAAPFDIAQGQLGGVLGQLNSADLCHGKSTQSCDELCALLASDCTLCGTDDDCKESAKQMCEKRTNWTCN